MKQVSAHSLLKLPAASFNFADLREEDLPILREWLSRPHVAQWWEPTPSVDELRKDYLSPEARRSSTRAYIAFRGSRAVGFMQSYVVADSGDGWWVDETDPGARGIDQFLADANDLGQGLGRALIRAFVERLFADPVVTVVQTDPHPSNERAIRCYTAAGFRTVGRVDTPNGPALLMRCTRCVD